MEKTVSKWKLRQPGERVAAAIFGRAGQVAEARGLGLAWREIFQWLVPVAGCALLVMASSPAHPTARNGLGTLSTNGLIAALGWAPSTIGNYGADSSHSEMNNLPRTTLNMTLATTAPSERAMLPSMTNQIDH